MSVAGRTENMNPSPFVKRIVRDVVVSHCFDLSKPLEPFIVYMVAEMFYFNYRSVQYKWCIFCTVSRFVYWCGQK